MLLALLVFLPVYGPYMVATEGRLLPVTTPIEFVEVLAGPEGGLDVRFRYTKLRECEYIDTQARVGEIDVDFAQVSGVRTTERLGPHVSRLWHLATASLDGLQVWVVHRCHPFWITATKVYG